MTLHQPEHPAHRHWKKIAADIRSQQPPLKGLVFISAHWQADPSEVSGKDMGVLVNDDESNPLLYDYYGFPQEMYELKLNSHNPPWLNSLVRETLNSEGLNAVNTQRGIDHGVFIALLAGFGEHGTGLPPMVQVSLPPQDAHGDDTQDGIRALRLGRALRALRSRGIAIVGGGQPVHNLGDFRHTFPTGEKTTVPYSVPFAQALTAAVCPPSSGTNDRGEPKRWEAAKRLFQNQYYRGAHPTSEHLLPALVALGAAQDEEEGKEEFEMNQGPLAWNMYKWGGSK